MKQNYDTIIGIDPDCDRSGAAVLDIPGRRMEVYSWRFPELMEFLPLRKREAGAEGRRLLVVVEASWMTETNWHGRPMDSRKVSSKKGYDVGRNHEAGRKIVEMAKDHYGLAVKCRHPLRKCWSGRDGKITHGEVVSLLAGSGVAFGKSRTNQEERDAILLALDASGIPMRMMKGGAR